MICPERLDNMRNREAGRARREELEAIPRIKRTIPEWVELVHLRALEAGTAWTPLPAP